MAHKYKPCTRCASQVHDDSVCGVCGTDVWGIIPALTLLAEKTQSKQRVCKYKMLKIDEDISFIRERLRVLTADNPRDERIQRYVDSQHKLLSLYHGESVAAQEAAVQGVRARLRVQTLKRTRTQRSAAYKRKTAKAGSV